MKYSDGGWLTKDGYEVEYAAHIYDSRIVGDKLILYAPFRYIDHKGLSLDGGMLTVEISSPMENILGLKVYHHKGFNNIGPSFNINKDKADVKIDETEEHWLYQSGRSKIIIQKGEELKFNYYFDDKFITSSGAKSKAYIIHDKKDTFISDQIDIGVGENIYGLGERFTSFIKNGQTVDIWNEDGGTGTEQAYKNIPFYMSNQNYGVLVNSPDKVSFEVGSEKVSKVQFSVPGEELEYFIIFDEDMKGVLNSYTSLTGKAPVPPTWSFGLWLSTSFLTDYDEKTVTHFVDGMIERDIPLDVFHFDCLWMREFEWCNFCWDERMFPDPQGLLNRLKEKNLRISLWINPYIGQKSPLFEEAMENGYFIQKENGDVWQWDKWQAGMGIIDFTNPEATKWYKNHLKRLVEMGVDSFKTDFGERIPTNVKYHDGSDPYRMHNYYSYLYNEVVYELLEELKGQGEAVLFARSGSVGSQKFPVHWGGDNTADYPSMAESLRAGLSFGLSGFTYWSHDIGGFESGCTPDLYKRWTQFGLLSSHSRYHGSWEYKVPWLYGEEAVDVTRYFTKLKMKLMPYLYAQSHESAQIGLPMLRPMILEFQEDKTSHHLDLQYMFGKDILVAPIFNEEGIADYYLPNGHTWTHLLDNREVSNTGWQNEEYDYFSLPIFVKNNTLIALGNIEDTADYDYTENFEIHAFEVENASTLIVNSECNEVSVKVVKDEQGYIVEHNSPEPFKVIFRNEAFEKFIKTNNVKKHELGVCVLIENNRQTFDFVKEGE